MAYRERRPLGDPRQVNVHEMLKADMFAANSPRCNDHFEKSRACPSAVYGVSDQYIVLDSRSAEFPTEPHLGRFHFSFMVQGASRERAIGIQDKLDNIIQIESLPFYIPLPLLDDISEPTLTGVGIGPLPGTSTDDPIAGIRTQLANSNTIVLLFPECRAQSYVGRNGRNYHFEYRGTITEHGGDGFENAALMLTPVNPVFTFAEPIQDIHDLTMQFWNPDHPLQLPLDRIEGVTFTTSGTGVLSINVPAALPDGQPIDLTQLVSANDRVYFENVAFTTDGSVPTPAALSNYFMRPNGIYVGGTINTTDATTAPTLTFPTPFQNATFASTTTVTMFIAKNRIRAPFRMRRIVDRLTNYIAP